MVIIALWVVYIPPALSYFRSTFGPAPSSFLPKYPGHNEAAVAQKIIDQDTNVDQSQHLANHEGAYIRAFPSFANRLEMFSKVPVAANMVVSRTVQIAQLERLFRKDNQHQVCENGVFNNKSEGISTYQRGWSPPKEPAFWISYTMSSTGDICLEYLPVVGV